MKEVFIVSLVRTPGGKAKKGSLKDTRPDELASIVIKEVVKRAGIEPGEVDDVIMGCAFPESEQGMNVARIASLAAGLPVDVPAFTINRFCASGLEAIATGAFKISTGYSDCVIAGGVESMTRVPMGGLKPAPNPFLMEKYPEIYLGMGLTAERVAEKYDIKREEQDKFAYESHMKAAKAIKEGKFKEEIVPVETRVIREKNGKTVIEEVVLEVDEGVREDTTIEALSKLKPVFKQGGTVTAGNSSQMTDGAAAVLLMSKEKAESLGLKPLLIFRGYAVTGVPPEIMGIGPVKAIPKVLEKTGLKLSDIGLIELNEAFAAQSLAVIKELDLNPDIINVNGGAIALGHPLGCTGAKLTCTLWNEMTKRNIKYGMVTMCIGGGMGAAGIFELP
jgi:acetyl-CoA acyltransferase